MRKFLVFACALALTGCAWFGWGEDAETAAPAAPETAEAQAATPEPLAEAPAVQVQQKQPAKKAAKPAKGAKSEAQIKTELDAMGRKLAAQSGRTLVPNRANPQYKQAGGQWIASFIAVDPQSVTTEMRPGTNSGQYVGIIRYQEKFMECTGATKQAALNGTCKQVKGRNLSELIHYDGRAWQD